MYKRITSLILILVSLSIFGQEENIDKLKFDTYDFPKAVVIDVKNKNQASLKKKVEAWIESYFTEITLDKSSFSKNTFFISAQSERFLKVKNLPSDLKFEIKISLRDNKYRFEVTNLNYKYYTEYRQISDVNLIKDEVIKKDLDQSRSLLSTFFNNLNSDLYQFIISENTDW